MMTKIKSILVAGVLCCCMASMFSSCSEQMNYEEYTVYTKKDIEGDFEYVGGLMSTIYRQLDYDYGQDYNGAMLASATDEAEYAYSGNTIANYYNGAWSASNPMSSVWTSAYKGISYCNLVLDEFQGLNFPEFEINLDYDKQMHRYHNYQFEARWARAYFYFLLLRQYGGVPLVTRNITAEESSMLSRNTADEVFQFIESECDAIKDSIIENYTTDETVVQNPETGRADKLAVLALKARAALYHASPLFNPGNDSDLWLKAAQAQVDLLGEAASQGKDLAISYSGLWATDNYKNSDACAEIILGRRVGSVNTPESYNFPVGIEGGKGGNCPTQNLVDAYEEGDERFEATIAKNGDTGWPAKNSKPLETYYGGINGQPLSGGTPTGYYLKKLCHGSISLAANSKLKNDYHTYTLFRLGEFWLNYAEAVFRYLGSADADTYEFPLSATYALNKIRLRAGLKALPEGLSNEEFWNKYKNERMVELAFEGHRFWDVRRWKEADKYFTAITELKQTLQSDGSIRAERITVHRQWDDKMYFYPIPQTERMKNPNLEQNPGW